MAIAGLRAGRQIPTRGALRLGGAQVERRQRVTAHAVYGYGLCFQWPASGRAAWDAAAAHGAAPLSSTKRPGAQVNQAIITLRQ